MPNSISQTPATVVTMSDPVASHHAIAIAWQWNYTIFRREIRRGNCGSVSPEVAAEAGVAGEFVGLDEE